VPTDAHGATRPGAFTPEGVPAQRDRQGLYEEFAARLTTTFRDHGIQGAMSDFRGRVRVHRRVCRGSGRLFAGNSTSKWVPCLGPPYSVQRCSVIRIAGVANIHLHRQSGNGVHDQL